MRTAEFIALASAFLTCAFQADRAISQQVTPFEAGIGYSAQSSTSVVGYSDSTTGGYWGPFARFAWNVNRSIALEASGFDSNNAQQPGDKIGGHQVLVLGGIKAGIRRKYVGVFGRIDAGAASFSQALELIEVENGRILNPPLIYRETHFALEPGGTIEAYVSSRTILRADVDENLNAVFRTVHPIGGGLSQNLGGYVPHRLGLSLSVERRFGKMEDEPELEPKPERFSAGAYFPLQIRQQLLEPNAPALGGGGAWVEMPAYRFLSTDVVAFDLPHDDHTAGEHDGGTPFALFAGPKAGFHRGRFAIFAKARPGFTRFSRTQFGLTLTENGQFLSVYHPQYQFSLDTGGVFEYAPARHLQLRLEAGDNLLFYHSHNVSYSYPGESGVATAPGTHASSMLFLAGAGWRF